MPEYVCLRCFSCGAFQGHQVRGRRRPNGARAGPDRGSTQMNRRSKFKCKLCSEAQSFRKVRGRPAGGAFTPPQELEGCGAGCSGAGD